MKRTYGRVAGEGLAGLSRTLSVLPLSPLAEGSHHGPMNRHTAFFRVRGRDAARTQRQHGSVDVLPDGPATGHTTLLFVGSDGPHQLSASCNGRCIRLAVRLRSSSLDRQLAHGCAPESNKLLAVRAQVLVTPDMRQALADLWGNLSTRALQFPVMRDLRVPLNREAIAACRAQIDEVRSGLLRRCPISAQGVATASQLLRDGSGPIYNRHLSTDHLDAALREAITKLDPLWDLEAV